MSPEFREYFNQLVIEHCDEHISPFQYEGKKFWLKQPEKLKGIWLLLKLHPKQSFKNELQTLLNLTEKMRLFQQSLIMMMIYMIKIWYMVFLLFEILLGIREKLLFLILNLIQVVKIKIG